VAGFELLGGRSRPPPLPLAAAATAIALAGAGGGFALLRRSDRAANRAALLEAQRISWLAQQQAQRAQAIYDDASAMTTAAIDVATRPTAAEPVVDPVRHTVARQPRGGGRASSGDETAVHNPFTAPAIVAPDGRRPVHTSLSGGIFATASRVEVGRQLAPIMGRIEACANSAVVPAGEGSYDGWGMDFDVTLEPSTGQVTRVAPRGDTTRSKPRLVGCMRAALFGQTLVTGGESPSAITLSFNNRYAR
jgi:hypothetical protein